MTRQNQRSSANSRSPASPNTSISTEKTSCSVSAGRQIPTPGSIRRAEMLTCSTSQILPMSKRLTALLLKNVSICDALSNYRAILASPDKNLFGFAYGLYTNSGTGDYYHTEERIYYGLLSYSEEDGFVPGAYLNITQSGLFDDALTNTEYRTMRGIYISDTFYLVTENGIGSYDMTDGYKLFGYSSLGIIRNPGNLSYLLLAGIRRIVYTRNQLDEK